MAGKLDLGKMVGPLPVGAWIGAGAVGIGAGVYLNMRRKNAAAAASDGAQVLDTTALGPKGTVAVVPNGGILLPNGASGSQSSGASTSTDVSNKPQDNQQWSQLVLTTLLASGYQAGAVSAALANYLGGQSLDAQQRALIDLAIAKVGLPPNPVPLSPTPTQPTVTTPTPTTAAKGQYAVIDADGQYHLIPVGSEGQIKALYPNAKAVMHDGIVLTQADFAAIGRL
jgi:hypothetical protein